MRTIYFDMDGTLANLYSVDNWLDYLRAFDNTPYKIAKVMHNMSALARLLHRVQRLGYQIGIISWLSMESNAQYDKEVTAAKLEWLKAHLPSVEWDYIAVTPYGIPKHSLRNDERDILFDDNAQIREEWGCEAYSPNDILSVLRALQ